MSFRSESLRKLLILSAAVVPVVAVTGCGNMVTTASPTNDFSTSGMMTGQIHGGAQGVSGANVLLYTVGTTGYGTPGPAARQHHHGQIWLLLLHPESFRSLRQHRQHLRVPCHHHPDLHHRDRRKYPRAQVVRPTAPPHLSPALGQCGPSATASIDMNEVTTVGTMAALQQYFDPALESFGYPSTTQGTLGYTNAVATIANLVNASVGTAGPVNPTLSAVPAGTTNSVSVTLTAGSSEDQHDCQYHRRLRQPDLCCAHDHEQWSYDQHRVRKSVCRRCASRPRCDQPATTTFTAPPPTFCRLRTSC